MLREIAKNPVATCQTLQAPVSVLMLNMLNSTKKNNEQVWLTLFTDNLFWSTSYYVDPPW